MNQLKIHNFLKQNVSRLKGVGTKTKILLKKKKIEKISDLLWALPESFTDRSELKKLNNLEIGKIATIKVKVVKYHFPRLRNLPNKVLCEDENNKIEIIFFNSREGYIRKILQLNSIVIVSGKVNLFKNKYQITNPPYIVPEKKEDYVNRVIPKYSLTEGLTEKIYRKLIEQVLNNITDVKEWHNENIMKKFDYKNWRECILHLHDPKIKQDFQSNYYRRLVYDEILSELYISLVSKYSFISLRCY